MGYSARVIKDSISPEGIRLTTMEATYPRFVHAELMTHRVFSRNTASSRAIPVEKQLAKVLDDPVLPVYWGANQPGMQAQRELSEDEKSEATAIWLDARNTAVLGAVSLAGGVEQIKDQALAERIQLLKDVYAEGFGAFPPTYPLKTPVHKQIINRLLEPFLWHTALVSSTEWENFYALRTHPDAQPEIRQAAVLMKQAYETSEPDEVNYGEYHLPFIKEEERDRPISEQLKISVGRCARISYLTHDGACDPEKDQALTDRLLSDGHMSPLEHAATPFTKTETEVREKVRQQIDSFNLPRLMGKQIIDATYFLGNFRGWRQYRKYLPNEDNFSIILQDRI